MWLTKATIFSPAPARRKPAKDVDQTNGKISFWAVTGSHKIPSEKAEKSPRRYRWLRANPVQAR